MWGSESAEAIDRPTVEVPLPEAPITLMRIPTIASHVAKLVEQLLDVVKARGLKARRTDDMRSTLDCV
jgi:hypothetical protein